jgi:hypothetical protein
MSRDVLFQPDYVTKTHVVLGFQDMNTGEYLFKQRVSIKEWEAFMRAELKAIGEMKREQRTKGRAK